MLRSIDRHLDVNQSRKVADDEAVTEAINFVASSPQKQQLDEKIEKISKEISNLNLSLMNNIFNSQIQWRTVTDGEFNVWQKIKNYIDIATFPADEQVMLIKKEIAVLKNNVELRKVEMQGGAALREVADTASKTIEEANKKLNQLLIAQQEKSVARMEEALQLAKAGRDKEVAAIVKEVEDGRTSALGLAISFSARWLCSACLARQVHLGLWGTTIG